MFCTLGDIFPLCCLPVIECNICRPLSMTPDSPGSPQSPDLYHRMNARRFTEHFSIAPIEHLIFFHAEFKTYGPCAILSLRRELSLNPDKLPWNDNYSIMLVVFVIEFWSGRRRAWDVIFTLIHYCTNKMVWNTFLRSQLYMKVNEAKLRNSLRKSRYETLWSPLISITLLTFEWWVFVIRWIIHVENY